MSPVEDTLRALLGEGVALALADPGALATGLMPEETPAVARAVPKRRAEFAAGRRAARAALAQLGLPAQAIPQGPDRAPRWPAGVTGSISHCDGLCVAVASVSGPALGVDIEPATPLAADLMDLVCTPSEQAWAAIQPDPGLAAKQVFSAKEACYKAQYPLTGQLIGFDALTLTIAPDGSFTARSALPLPRLTGATRIAGGLILSVCRARAPASSPKAQAHV